jgi:hypothetical protein
MPVNIFLIVFSLLVMMTGCKSSDAPPPSPGAPASASPASAVSPGAPAVAPATPTVKAKVDVCQLLTGDDLKAVQGESPREAQRSDRQEGGFIVAQCYYALPTSSNSVVLNVTTASEGATASPRKFWEDTFGKAEREGKEKTSRERERERRAAKEKDKKRGAEREEEEEGARPEKINGLGDEAFWIASRVGGALYVLRKDVFFRISVGGAGDEKSKLRKSRTLARQVLKRL